MTDIKEKLEEMKASIELLRDEVNLQAHLGKAEAKEELEKLDEKWNSFLKQYRPLSEEAGKTAENAGAALALAAEELKTGYKRIRKLF